MPFPNYETNHERRAKLLELKDQGFSFNQIARVFGVSAQAVKAMYARIKAQQEVTKEVEKNDTLH